MKKKIWVNLGLILIIMVIFSGLIASLVYIDNLPERISQHETIILGQNQLVPGSEGAIRVVVRDTKDASVINGAKISVSLKPAQGGEPTTLYKGVTDEMGGVEVVFQVPDDIDPEQTLIIQTVSELGSDLVERPVRIERDYKVLLTTDKPIYQPSQVIRIRALALSSFDQVPASERDLEITIADGKGNKVYRKGLKTSTWGIASVDFQLASEVNTGVYQINATLGNTSSEKTVTVEHYVLPKFDVKIDTEKSYYLPGDRVSGHLQADYFFGKPVSEGEVTLEGYTFDFEKIVSVQVTGKTDEAGGYDFEFELPGYFSGTDFDGGLGRFYLQAAVTDQAKHTEISNTSLPVSSAHLVIEAVPEGGSFKPGVENILYVLTSYPDGTPAETNLDINFYNSGDNIGVETGTYGLAEVPFTPNDPWQGFNIQAQDRMGHSANQEFYFEGQWQEETILLRTGRPVYQVGDSMDLTVLTTAQSGTVYMDIVRGGQTVRTQTVDITEGITMVQVDLTPDLFGTLEIHAYKILRSGSISRDTRLVVVDHADDLILTMQSEKDTYIPGETASVILNVQDHDGKGIWSAIGLAVVDEAVFALAEQDPGFAKLYFMLEQEILEPKYDLHGYSITDLVSGASDSNPELVRAIEKSAQATLSEAIPQQVHFSLEANSHEEALQTAYTRRERYFETFSKGLLGSYLVTSVLPMILSGITLTREKSFNRSLFYAFLSLVFMVVVVWVWPHPWASGPLEKLGIFYNWLFGEGENIVVVLATLSVVGWISLAVVAIREKNGLVGWMVGLIPVSAVLLVMTAFTASEGGLSPDNLIFIASLLASLLIPFAFLVRFFGYILNKQVVPALSCLSLVFFLVLVLVPFASRGGTSMVKADFRDQGLMVEPVMEMAIMDAGLGFEGEAMANAVMEVEEKDSAGPSLTNGGESRSEPPRLRQYFPETMTWIPEILTDEEGEVGVEFLVADSITTWRMTALASTQDGRLGSTTAPLSVFQDFFIDLDLPTTLTVGDEVSVPVGIFNYLEVPQTIQLELEPADWFEMLDPPEKEIELGENDVSVVYFRIRATRFGQGPFKVTAWGSQMSDAILKEVRVYPDGKKIPFTRSDRLNSETIVEEMVVIPEDALIGTQKVTVKIYPGILSQVVEGLENILRMPYGCFEQTSSTTYPNVLVLDYLNFTDQAAPEVQFKADEYINLGYQRLTTFEVGGSGGFSLFGDPPPDRMLTAYGLQEFSDMGRVHRVDPALVERAANWLFSQQSSDGSWENDRGLVHENTWSNLGDDRLPVTAYIVWSLADAGYGDDPRTQAGLAYVKENLGKAEDAYSLSLIANALVAVDISSASELMPVTLSALEQLAGMSIQEGNGVTWRSSVATFMGSEGQTGSIETTALAALSFLRANRYPEIANAALTALIQQKDSFGTWYSTQATVLALKALIQSAKMGAENVDAVVTVRLNDGRTRTLKVTPENFDVVQMMTFDDINIGRENLITIEAEGEGNLMYQVSGSYYLPWDKIEAYPQLTSVGDVVSIELNYDRAEMSVNDTVGVQVLVTLKEGQAESALIDLGLPPGFSVETEDLAALVARFDDVPEDYAFPTIERFELTGRQILIYVNNLTENSPLSFNYHLRAKYPIMAKTPASNAYDYYNPDVNGEAVPLTLVVNE